MPARAISLTQFFSILGLILSSLGFINFLAFLDPKLGPMDFREIPGNSLADL